MAQIAPIIFIGILYGIWKWLDSMQLPNTISIFVGRLSSRLWRLLVLQ